jgi:hypothetical protein
VLFRFLVAVSKSPFGKYFLFITLVQKASMLANLQPWFAKQSFIEQRQFSKAHSSPAFVLALCFSL